MRNALGIISLSILTFMMGVITKQTLQLPRQVITSEQIPLEEVIPEVIDSVIRVVDRGSGFFISKNHIITNAHVVGEDTILDIVTHNGIEVKANLIISDRSMDIAILEVGIEGVPVNFAQDWKLGETVFAIGHPYGLLYTVTKGIISSKVREAPNGMNITKMVQFDADINPGNSGGALFNMKGELIGMPTLGYSGSNLELAVSIKYIKGLFEMFVE